MLGQVVQKYVEREHRLELGLVQTLLPKAVELTVLEMLKKLKTATLTLVQVKIKTTLSERKNCFNNKFRFQISIPDFNSRLKSCLMMRDDTIDMWISNYNYKQFQLTEDGRAIVLGQNVQKYVEQEHRLELGPVQTLLPNTVELIVLDMLKKLGNATLNHVLVKV